MKTPADFEKIQHIIEKIERGEILDESEKTYLDIIKALKAKKDQNIQVDADFLSSLKDELLTKYDELYGKKGFYQKLSSILQNPFLEMVLSFCFIFIIAFGVYSGLNPGHKGGIEFSSRDTSHIATESSLSNSLPQTSKEEEYTEVHSSLDSISESKEYSRRGGGLEFGGGDGVISHSIRGSSDGGSSYFSGIARIIGENLIIVGVLLISALTALIIVLRKKKK